MKVETNEILPFLQFHYISALLYDHLYKSVFPELERKDQPIVGSSYADVGATIDGNGWTDVATKPGKNMLILFRFSY